MDFNQSLDKIRKSARRNDVRELCDLVEQLHDEIQALKGQDFQVAPVPQNEDGGEKPVKPNPPMDYDLKEIVVITTREEDNHFSEADEPSQFFRDPSENGEQDPEDEPEQDEQPVEERVEEPEEDAEDVESEEQVEEHKESPESDGRVEEQVLDSANDVVLDPEESDVSPEEPSAKDVVSDEEIQQWADEELGKPVDESMGKWNFEVTCEDCKDVIKSKYGSDVNIGEYNFFKMSCKDCQRTRFMSYKRDKEFIKVNMANLHQKAKKDFESEKLKKVAEMEGDNSELKKALTDGSQKSFAINMFIK